MKMQGERRIEASREEVWTALNDPAVLKKCIAGCTELEKTSDTDFSAKVTAKAGPVKASFIGTVTLSDIKAPESYTIKGEGKGGAAGFAKGGAKVSLAEDGAVTVLTYDVDAKVGGKLAQVGSRLINSSAQKMADDFFDKFTHEVAPEPEAQSNTDTDDETGADENLVTPPPVNDNAEDTGAQTPVPGTQSRAAALPGDAPADQYVLAGSPETASRNGHALWWIAGIAVVLAGLYLVRY